MPTEAEILRSYPRPAELAARRVHVRVPSQTSAPREYEARISALAREWKTTYELRSDAAFVTSFAGGNQISSTPGMPNEPWQHQATKPRFAANLLDYILQRFSYLYAEAPIRVVEQADRWRDILWTYDLGLDAILDDAMATTRLTGTQLAYVMPSYGAGMPQDVIGIAESGATPVGLDVFVIPFERFCVLQHSTDPRHVGAVAIHVDTALMEQPNGKPEMVEVHHYWDSERFAVLHDWHVVREAPHAIGMPPVAMLKGTLAPSRLYGDPIGGTDLLTNLQSINGCIEELLHTARLQRGQPVVSGSGDTVQLGPDCPIRVEAAGDFQFVSNMANIGGMVQAVDVALDRLAQSLGMPRSSFRVTDSPSGAAVVADRIELAEDRRKQRRVWQANERGIHRVGAAVWAAHTGEVLPWDVTVTYPERPAMLTHAERMDEVRLALSEGLMSRREAAHRLDPERSPAELDAMLAEADADIPARMRWRAVIAGHAADMAPDTATDMPQLDAADEDSDGPATE